MRVSSFFRAHKSPFDLGVEPKDKRRSRNPSGHLTARPKLGARTDSSLSTVSSNETNDSMLDAHKRSSLHLIRSPRGSSRSLERHERYGATSLAVAIESPPLVFYGQPSTSTGALLSGLLKLNIGAEELEIDSFTMKLVVDVKMKKPFHAHCVDCANQSSDIMDWKFLHAATIFKKGDHDFPFSFLLPGHLPATMQGSLSTIQYVLKAVITPKTGDVIKLSHPLNVRRAIQPSEIPRQSIRIFPPTNLTAHVGLPSVIHPIGEFNATFRLDGIIKRNTDTGTQTHWRLKRLTWRLDETQKVISPACPKHALKAGAGPDEKKGFAHQEVRTLNTVEIKSGWKSDYSSPDGSIEMEFPFSIRPDAHPICDVKAEDGTDVSHILIVEMIVAEEYAPIKRPHQVTPTGAARVLRMHFNTIVTERGGMGISWDEEQPPLYQNVPASPPVYGNTENYGGSPIPDYEELEMLPSPSHPAVPPA